MLKTQEDRSISSIFCCVLWDNPVLLDKSQIPDIKTKKQRSLIVARQHLQVNCGKVFDEKQIPKRIANMKARVKRKCDMKQTGNKRVELCGWEKDMYKLLEGDSNPMITKLSCSESIGVNQPSTINNQPVNQLQCGEMDVKPKPSTEEENMISRYIGNIVIPSYSYWLSLSVR